MKTHKCDKCQKITPLGFLNFVTVDTPTSQSGQIHLMAKWSPRFDGVAIICDFCLQFCQDCKRPFLSDEGLIESELDKNGFLTGEWTVLCPFCALTLKLETDWDIHHEYGLVVVPACLIGHKSTETEETNDETEWEW